MRISAFNVWLVSSTRPLGKSRESVRREPELFSLTDAASNARGGEDCASRTAIRIRNLMTVYYATGPLWLTERYESVPAPAHQRSGGAGPRRHPGREVAP